MKPTVTATQAGQLTVSWNSVPCATSYRVYQLDIRDDKKWKPIRDTTGLQMEFEHDPCTEYEYGVAAVVSGMTTRILKAKKTPTENNDKISEFAIQASAESAQFSWISEACITSYGLRLCKDDRYECYEEEFTTNQTGKQRITKTVKHLTPGSKYTGTVFFTSNGTESEGETKNFITEASKQIAPDNFIIATCIIAAIIVLGAGIVWVVCFKPPKYNAIMPMVPMVPMVVLL